MGHQAHIIDHQAHIIDNPDWRLWTRGGTRDVFLRNDNTKEEIRLPASILQMLVAEDIRTDMIRTLENLTDEELLALPGAGQMFR